MKASDQSHLKYTCCLFSLMLMSSAVAQQLPDLPHAFSAGWKGEKTCELLYELPTVRVGKCTFPPGVGHEKHYHYPHFGYVLEGGTMQITNDQGLVEVRRTTTGDNWNTSEITLHEAMNIGDTTTSYLIVEPKYPEPKQLESDPLESGQLESPGALSE